jgi:hypothetical protein
MAARLSSLLTAAFLVACSASSAAAEGETLPAIQRCEQFCARVYGEGSAEHHECALACGEADACHQRCKQKFGGDVGKVRTCLRTCMAHGDKRDETPANPGVEL